MANKIEIGNVNEDLKKMLTKAFQSSHVNFLLGSGASLPSMPLAGDIENEITTLFENGQPDDAYQKLYEFLINIQKPANRIISDTLNSDDTSSINNYTKLLGVIEDLLVKRETNLLPKQVNIFTTNYDFLIEKASEAFQSLKLNDGFKRTSGIKKNFLYSSGAFFDLVYNTSRSYSYKVAIPSVNLIKLHGSLTWKKNEDEIVYEVINKTPLSEDASIDDKKKYNAEYSLILPQKDKFRETIIDRTYYDLLRIYANELDKENALLITFGFSFADEHIFDITTRALKNPALKLIIFAHKHDEGDLFDEKFSGYHNVDVIYPPSEEKIDFNKFNSTIDIFYNEVE